MYLLSGLGIWLSIESLHYLYVRHVLYKKVCAIKNRSFTIPNPHVKSLFDLLASLKTYSFKMWMDGIFLKNGANICLANIVSCMSWMHYYLPIQEISEEQSEENYGESQSE